MALDNSVSHGGVYTSRIRSDDLAEVFAKIRQVYLNLKPPLKAV